MIKQSKLSPSDIERIVFLRGLGLTMKVISQRMGVGETRIQTLLAKTKGKA
jgi:hypothetical protein